MKSKDPVRQTFTEVDGKSSATCNACKNQVSAKVERLKTHRTKCSSLKKRPAEENDSAEGNYALYI